MTSEIAKVLIVDDSLTNRLVLDNYIKALGYKPLMAVDGVAALEHVRKEPPDLVLLDIIMPRMDGYEVLSQLKTDETTRDIPVIMISGIDEMESVVRCIQQGAEDYLPRPINTTLLKARAGASLEKKRLRDEEKRKTVALALALDQLQEATGRIQQEVDHIAAIQRALLPQKLPTITGLEIAASYDTFDKAGGDLYDFIPMGDPASGRADSSGPWGILMADASGHGPAAAVVTAIVNALLRAYPKKPSGPGEVLAHINRHLSAKMLESSFVTAFFGIYDPVTRQIVYALAGHDPPLCKRAGDNGKIERWPDVDGLPLGVMDEVDFVEKTVQLQPGDILYLFTDGITEASGPSGALFGLPGIQKSLANPANSVQDVIAHIRAGLLAHEDGTRPHDDQTMVAIRVKP